MDNIFDLSTAQIDCLEDLRKAFLFASTRRLEKIWKFLNVYTLNDFSLVSSI